MKENDSYDSSIIWVIIVAIILFSYVLNNPRYEELSDDERFEMEMDYREGQRGG